MSVGNFAGFIGRLTREPEVRETGSHKVLNFTLARNRYTKDKEHPISDFIDCVAWDSTAELIARFFKKGERIGVIGNLRSETYEDSNGIKRKKTEIYVQSIEFIENKKDGAQSNSGNTEYSDGDTESPANTSEEDDDGGLPF